MSCLPSGYSKLPSKIILFLFELNSFDFLQFIELADINHCEKSILLIHFIEVFEHSCIILILDLVNKWVKFLSLLVDGIGGFLLLVIYNVSCIEFNLIEGFHPHASCKAVNKFFKVSLFQVFSIQVSVVSVNLVEAAFVHWLG